MDESEAEGDDHEQVPIIAPIFTVARLLAQLPAINDTRGLALLNGAGNHATLLASADSGGWWGHGDGGFLAGVNREWVSDRTNGRS